MGRFDDLIFIQIHFVTFNPSTNSWGDGEDLSTTMNLCKSQATESDEVFGGLSEDMDEIKMANEESVESERDARNNLNEGVKIVSHGQYLTNQLEMTSQMVFLPFIIFTLISS